MACGTPEFSATTNCGQALPIWPRLRYEPEAMKESIEHPKAGLFLNLLGRFLFWLTGWKTEGSIPPIPRFVVIAAPHTSYWDALVMLTAGCVFNVKFSWMVKDAVFF